ncbi:unnamed protein product [Brassica rapa]|uniref:RNase H type-1 domain-containing protein n=1 Tax=Brassica campestris TaxID=3711 RepID=A0A8D9GHA3_BRACM|nr:unnamed protein product [Brassica rapa]
MERSLTKKNGEVKDHWLDRWKKGQKCTHSAQSPLKTEAEALIWALSEMKNRGWDGVTVESDCQQLINIIRAGRDYSA